MRKRIKIGSFVLLIVSAVGLFVSPFVNEYVFDEYDAYGEVPVPGTQTRHLPAGDVTVSFLAKYPEGDPMEAPIPIPQDLEMTITPPVAAPEPVVTRISDSDSDCATDNDTRDGHCSVQEVHISQAGDYTITAKGNISLSVKPRLAFGHPSRFWFVTWLFGGLCVVSLVTFFVALAGGGSASGAPDRPKTVLEQLTVLASLHNSGALTEEEYEDEKRRLLDGL